MLSEYLVNLAAGFSLGWLWKRLDPTSFSYSHNASVKKFGNVYIQHITMKPFVLLHFEALRGG